MITSLLLDDPLLTQWTPPQDQYHSLDRFTDLELLAWMETQRALRRPIPPKPAARDIALAEKLLGPPPPEGGLFVTLSLPQLDPHLPPLVVGPALTAVLPPLGQTFERTEGGSKAYYLLSAANPEPDHTALVYTRIDKIAYQAVRKLMKAATRVR